MPAADTVSLVEQLFVKPDLGTWSNVIGVVGAIISVLTYLYTRGVNKELEELKRKISLKQGIAKHHKSLETVSSSLNSLLNTYASNLNPIKAKISELSTELDIILRKVNEEDREEIIILKEMTQALGKKNLIITMPTLKPRKMKRYRRHNADVNDVWDVYNSLQGVRTRVGEINRTKNSII